MDITQKPTTTLANYTLFWISITLISILGASVYFTYQEEISPNISTPITMSANEAEEKALAIIGKHPLALNAKKIHSSSVYETDNNVNNYITLQAGGNKVLNQLLLEKKLISSYWLVRAYEESNPEEYYLMFSPSGEYYGLSYHIQESTERPNISKEQALTNIQAYLQANPLAQLNFSEYKLIDYQKETHNNGRTDQTFIYEHPTKTLERAKYKLKITVSGDTITTVYPHMDLPESFGKTYSEMRSYNDVLATIGNVILYVGYGAIIITSIIYGIEKREIAWHHNTILTLSVVSLGVLSSINALPTTWFYSYNSVMSFSVTYLNLCISIVYGSLSEIIILGLSFIAGDMLSRKAFPNHINFYKAWRKESQSTLELSEQIALGYTLFFLCLGYIAIFYVNILKLPGFWSPSYNLKDPNIISDYLPFFNPFSRSIHAGFWEEFLFRAVPIGASVWLGQHLKKPWLIWPTIILQAIIFGFAHTSYPQQPAFIRIIELSIIFVVYGLVYVYYGLIPCIISHYLFDVLLMSENLFYVQTPNIVWQQLGAVLAISAPLLFHLVQRARTGHLASSTTLSESMLNKAWEPPKKLNENITDPVTTSPIHTIWYNIAVLFTGVALLSLSLNVHNIPTSPVTPLTLSKTNALKKAKKIASEHIDLEKNWTVTINANLQNSGLFYEYLHDVTPKDMRKNILYNYSIESKHGISNLHPIFGNHYWNVAFKRFDGNLIDKMEMFEVTFKSNTDLISFQHYLSEEVSRKNISEPEAQTLAFEKLVKQGFNKSQFSIVTATTDTQPSGRLDQNVVMQDNINKTISNIDIRAYYNFMGDRLSGVDYYFKIPAEWLKNQDINKAFISAILNIIAVANQIIYLGAFFYCIHQASNGVFSLKVFTYTFLALFVLNSAEVVNELPMYLHTTLSPLKPLMNQYLTYALSTTVSFIFGAASLSLLLCYSVGVQKSYQRQETPFYIFSNGFMLGVGVWILGILTHFYYYPMPIEISYTVYLNTYLPILTTVQSAIPNFLNSCVYILCLVNIYHTNRSKHKPTARLQLLLLWTGVIADILLQRSITSIPILLVNTVLYTSLISALYIAYIKKNNTIIVGMVAGTYLSSMVFQLVTQAHFDHLWLLECLRGIIVLATAYAFIHILIMHQRNTPQEES